MSDAGSDKKKPKMSDAGSDKKKPKMSDTNTSDMKKSKMSDTNTSDMKKPKMSDTSTGDKEKTKMSDKEKTKMIDKNTTSDKKETESTTSDRKETKATTSEGKKPPREKESKEPKRKSVWDRLPSQLQTAHQLLFEPAAHNLNPTSDPISEPESAEYVAYQFKINNQKVLFRVAKVTPTKNGQFVTFWKRPGGKGPIQPFDVNDGVQLFLVSVRDPKGSGIRGQFVFPRAELAAHGILSKNGKGGKRAIRVYPPWVQTESKQAADTQYWQVRHYLPMDGGKVDAARVRRLFACLLK